MADFVLILISNFAYLKLKTPDNPECDKYFQHVNAVELRWSIYVLLRRPRLEALGLSQKHYSHTGVAT